VLKGQRVIGRVEGDLVPLVGELLGETPLLVAQGFTVLSRASGSPPKWA
jgi:hypothetical protein